MKLFVDLAGSMSFWFFVVCLDLLLAVLFFKLAGKQPTKRWLVHPVALICLFGFPVLVFETMLALARMGPQFSWTISLFASKSAHYVSAYIITGLYALCVVAYWLLSLRKPRAGAKSS